MSEFPEAQCGVSSGFSFIYFFFYFFFYGKDLHEQPKVRALKLTDTTKWKKGRRARCKGLVLSPAQRTEREAVPGHGSACLPGPREGNRGLAKGLLAKGIPSFPLTMKGYVQGSTE